MNNSKGKIGFTAGNFDLLHPGYIYTFETAKKHCDYFMVFLQIDPSETRFTKYKTLMAIRYVDEVVTYQTEEDLIKLIEFYKPEIRILGDDYIGKRFSGDNLPPEVIYTTRAHGWSTTKLKDLITIQTVKQNPDLIDRAKNDDTTTDAQHLMLSIRDEIAQYVEGNLTEEQYKNGIKELLDNA